MLPGLSVHKTMGTDIQVINQNTRKSEQELTSKEEHVGIKSNEGIKKTLIGALSFPHVLSCLSEVYIFGFCLFFYSLFF